MNGLSAIQFVIPNKHTHRHIPNAVNESMIINGLWL